MVEELQEKYQVRPNLSETRSDKIHDVYEKFPLIAQTLLDLISENEKKDKRYFELIMAVETKSPNESRHDTALRYIKESQNKTQVAQKESLSPHYQ